MTWTTGAEIPIDAASITASDTARFWLKVDRSGGPDTCWQWRAARDRSGYGTFFLKGRKTMAHRVSAALSGCALHDGMVLDHTCENPGCVNPRHLVETTNTGNCWSRKINENSRSQIRGVTWASREQKWAARVKPSESGRERSVWLGYHDSVDAAARAVASWWWVHEPGARNVGIELLSEADRVAAVKRWGGEVA